MYEIFRIKKKQPTQVLCNRCVGVKRKSCIFNALSEQHIKKIKTTTIK